MRFVSQSEVAERIRGKTVAIVGSAPSVLKNPVGLVDSHDVVVRANNYRLSAWAGLRTDVHYSFYGSSIRKSASDLRRDGVTLCWCKCPNSKPIESPWHEANGKLAGIDFRYIYETRRAWWFCDTLVPDDASFLAKFELLDRRIPTTGFAAILDVLACEPASVYLTGFDFFTSGIHNVSERWTPGNPNDPIGHRPDMEMEWLRQNLSRYPLKIDRSLRWALGTLPSSTEAVGIPVF
jgi:hypothetical protein